MHNLISNKKKLILSFIIIASMLSMSFSYYNSKAFAFTHETPENEMKPIIEELYNITSNAFVSGNLTILKPLFDLSKKQGRWSLEHEVRRVKYLKDWAKKRDIRFINVESSVRIKRTVNKGNILRFALEESYKFDYIYTKDPIPEINSFGVGIRHALSLINKNGKWIIFSDWYTDCFEDAMGSYSGRITTESAIMPDDSYLALSQRSLSNTSYGYNRQKAVEYADKYCGAAWGSGNNYKYNRKYSDYNGMGGDCTNYISQVLGDKEGGGLKQSGGWYPGAHSWSNVDGLKDHILGSGKGYVISKGTFEELTKKGANYPDGIISKLMSGDLICFVKKGDPDHFAVVTGRDSHGYPLVNSHTTDRYHVPWDLGWGNKNIKFILVHING